MDRVHATIPLEIEKPVRALCEVDHTWFGAARMRWFLDGLYGYVRVGADRADAQ